MNSVLYHKIRGYQLWASRSCKIDDVHGVRDAVRTAGELMKNNSLTSDERVDLHARFRNLLKEFDAMEKRVTS